MRVLLLSPNYPYPANKGDRIRVNGILQSFNQNETLVDLLCLDRRQKIPKIVEPQYLNVLGVFSINRFVALLRVVLGVFLGKSATTSYFSEKKFIRVLSKIDLNQYQKIVICSSCLGFLIPLLKKYSDKIIWDLIDVDSLKWQELSKKENFIKKAIYLREFKIIQKLEKQIAEISNQTLLISNREIRRADHLKEYSDKIKLLKMYVPIKDYEKVQTEKKQIIFSGQMDYFPNIEAVEFFYDEILPVLNQELGSESFEFIVAGRNPSDSLIKKCSKAHFTGEVEDIYQIINQAYLSISPLKSSFGVPTKVIEAMFLEVPAVVTPEVAEALDLEHEREVLIADNAEDFAQQIIRLFKDQSLKQNLVDHAKSFAKNHHGLKNLVPDT